LEYFLAHTADVEPTERLAAVELMAAGVLADRPDPNVVSLEYERLLEDYPESPLIHYRYGAYLLGVLQKTLKTCTADQVEERADELADFIRRARMELIASAEIDPHNSLPYFEMAFSHYALADEARAVEWIAKAVEAPEFDAGDDVVLAGASKLMMDAHIPPLEAHIGVYDLARVAPEALGQRMEAMASGLLSERATLRHAVSQSDIIGYMAGFEDMSAKLFHTAEVLRQSQAGLVTSGILWQRAAREALINNDAALAGAARAEMAKASYRYLLIGAHRRAVGLLPQQGVIELDVPLDLRLPFSHAAQKLAGTLFLLMISLLPPLALFAAASLRWKGARQFALSLLVLFIFTALSYTASFYATTTERIRTKAGLEARLVLLREGPAAIGGNGELADPSGFDSEVAKSMLDVPFYTLQAGRVLAYVGTRDCYEELISALDRVQELRVSDIVKVLREETGCDFGYDPAGSRADNMKAIDAWKAWWQTARETFPEAPSDAPHRSVRGA
jgi:hypothetical protein